MQWRPEARRQIGLHGISTLDTLECLVNAIASDPRVFNQDSASRYKISYADLTGISWDDVLVKVINGGARYGAHIVSDIEP